jgi:hypothetical protein
MFQGRPEGVGSKGQFKNEVCKLVKTLPLSVGKKSRAHENVV